MNKKVLKTLEYDKVKQNLPIISGEPLQISRKMIQKRHFDEKGTKKAPGKNLGAL